MKVIKYSIDYSIKEACLKFHIDLSMICRWKKKQDILESAKKPCRRFGKSGRPVAHMEEEKKVYDWIIDKSSRYLTVTFEDIQDIYCLIPKTSWHG